jgi:hypothetical protein
MRAANHAVFRQTSVVLLPLLYCLLPPMSPAGTIDFNQALAGPASGAAPQFNWSANIWLGGIAPGTGDDVTLALTGSNLGATVNFDLLTSLALNSLNVSSVAGSVMQLNLPTSAFVTSGNVTVSGGAIVNQTGGENTVTGELHLTPGVSGANTVYGLSGGTQMRTTS